MEGDDGFLIEQVSMFPALFDKSDARYKNKLVKENAWKTIGMLLNHRPELCEQRRLVLRAKNVKLLREAKGMPSGSGAFNITWSHYEAMRFLDPFLTTRKTTSNYSVPSSKTNSPLASPSENAEGSHWDIMETETDDVNTQECSLPFLSPSTTPNSTNTMKFKRVHELNLVTDLRMKQLRQARPASASDSGTKKLQMARQTINLKNKTPQEAVFEKKGSCFDAFKNDIEKKQNQPSNEDRDKSFALSLADEMKILSAENKVYFKQQVYTILNNLVQNN